jgi:hypothetical protein
VSAGHTVAVPGLGPTDTGSAISRCNSLSYMSLLRV